MKKTILPILLSLSILIRCGCQNHPAVNSDVDSSDKITSVISDNMWNTDAEKIDLPAEYYDYSKMQIYNNSLYISAKKYTKESDFYYKVFLFFQSAWSSHSTSVFQLPGEVLL